MSAFHILGIPGSLQSRSANAAVLRAAVRQAPPALEVVVFEALREIPPLDVELDGEGALAPAAVHELRSALAACDGALIVSPEYAHSLPGVLKNALDWLVPSGELANLPLALIGSSPTHTGAIRGQMALIDTLLAQSAAIAATLTIPGVKGKLDSHGELADPSALRRVRETLVALSEAVAAHRAWLAG